MRKLLFLLLVALTPALARAQLEWRISAKLFTGPGGALPQNICFGDNVTCWTNGANLFELVSNNVVWVNQILDSLGRGYRWRLLEVVTVPGSTLPRPTTTNSWYNMPVTAGNQDELDAVAKANAAGFQYRNNALNLYFVNGGARAPVALAATAPSLRKIRTST